MYNVTVGGRKMGFLFCYSVLVITVPILIQESGGLI